VKHSPGRRRVFVLGVHSVEDAASPQRGRPWSREAAAKADVDAALAWLFVSDRRATAPRLAPPAPYRSCPLPVSEVRS
jgi:hypothetical protein